ncbi:MAG: sulfotransferase family 2 domain-containing protein [Aquificaceae bacterium]
MNYIYRLFLRLFSEHIVSEFYRGILGREPDTSGIDGYKKKLRYQDISEALREIINSEEFRKRYSEIYQQKLIEDTLEMLYLQKPNEKEINEYKRTLLDKGFRQVLENIVESSRFFLIFLERKKYQDPALFYEKPIDVFMHIQKCAGTSLVTMLREAYGEESVYHGSGHFMLHPGELTKYSLVAGHFNYDHIKLLIPRKNMRIFTFLRNPKDRFLSFYYYVRAHDPGVCLWLKLHDEHGLLHRLSLLDLLKHPYTLEEWRFNMNMTYMVMGTRVWKEWRERLSSITTEEEKKEFIDKVARPAIASRLNEFFFVGIQEDFENSVKMLFKKLGKSCPPIKRENILSEIVEKNYGMLPVKKETLTPQIEAQIDKLIELDKIIYQEGIKVYERSKEELL